MSSVYQDKGKEELEAKLDTYKLNFKERIDEDLIISDLQDRLKKRIEDEKQKLFISVYGTSSVKDMKTTLSLIEEDQKKSNNTQHLKMTRK